MSTSLDPDKTSYLVGVKTACKGYQQTTKFATSRQYKELNIRQSYHECEGGIDTSVPKISVWYHKACQLVQTVIPRDGFFVTCSHKFSFSLIIDVRILTPYRRRSKTLLTIEECGSNIARNSVFNCHLATNGNPKLCF